MEFGNKTDYRESIKRRSVEEVDMVQFRGKDSRTGRWVRGFSIKNNKIMDSDFEIVYDIVPGSIGMITGIVADSDPFEEDVFTGDVVRVVGQEEFEGKLFKVCYGKYFNKDAGYNLVGVYLMSADGKTYGMGADQKYYVVGNVTDKPGLWEK